MVRHALASLVLLAASAAASENGTANAGAVAAIKAGQHDCPHCMLAGADLTNQCIKGGNLEGADLDDARLVLACMSSADFKGASFRRADLSGANLSGSNLDDADLTDAELNITSIKGTNLAHATGLTQHQLDQACGDNATRAPAGLTVRPCD